MSVCLSVCLSAYCCLSVIAMAQFKINRHRICQTESGNWMASVTIECAMRDWWGVVCSFSRGALQRILMIFLQYIPQYYSETEDRWYGKDMHAWIAEIRILWDTCYRIVFRKSYIFYIHPQRGLLGPANPRSSRRVMLSILTVYLFDTLISIHSWVKGIAMSLIVSTYLLWQNFVFRFRRSEYMITWC